MVRQPRRIRRDVPIEELERLSRLRDEVVNELPELTSRDQLRKDARDESTFSGELRCAIHESDLTLTEIAKQAGITPIALDDFLTGERTLRSDVIDRLATVLGCTLNRTN